MRACVYVFVCPCVCVRVCAFLMITATKWSGAVARASDSSVKPWAMLLLSLYIGPVHSAI